MNELPPELNSHINQFLAPQDLAALEQTHKKIPGQYESAVYGAIIGGWDWEKKFSFHFPNQYKQLLKKDKKTFKAIDWQKEFKKADDLQYPRLTSHQRHLFHLLKEESIQSENLKNAFEKEKENLKKQKRTLQDILFIKPIEDKDGLTLAACAVQQKDRTAKDYFYETISQYYAQDITKINSKGNSLLHWAVYFDQSIEIIEQLISKTNADLKEKNNDGETLLHLACANGHLKIASLLLKKNSELANETNKYGSTPLHLACKNGHLEIASLLLEKNSELANETNKYGNTALHWVCADGHLEIATLLLKANPGLATVENNFEETPLHWACASGHLEIATLLLEKNSKLANETNRNGSTPLHWACASGHLEIATLLLKANPGLATVEDNFEETPLYRACVDGHLEIATLLLKANPGLATVENNFEETPLHWACANGHLEIATLLLEKNSKLANETTKNGGTPLHLACKNGHLEIATLLLKANPGLATVENNFGETPLHLACASGHLEIATLLLKANPGLATVENNFEETPLQYARDQGHLEVVKVLKEYAHRYKKSEEVIKDAKEKPDFKNSELISHQIGKIFESYNNPSFLLGIFSWRNHKDLAAEVSRELLNPENSKKYSSASDCVKFIRQKIRDEKGVKKDPNYFNKYGTFYGIYQYAKQLEKQEQACLKNVALQKSREVSR